MSRFNKLIKTRKYELLLGSLLLLLFGALIVPSEHWSYFRSIFLFQNVIVGFILFFDQKIWRQILLALVIIITILEITELVGTFKLHSMTGIAYMVYFALLSIKVYRRIYKAKIIGREMISAVFCGFIMLTMIGSFIFLMIEIAHPASFSNLGEGVTKYQNIQYFSFITTLTIGYGDIVPLTNTAKQMTVLMGLAGNFYSVIVTGIVVGKFISLREQ